MKLIWNVYSKCNIFQTSFYCFKVLHFIIVRLQSILMQFKFTKTSFYEKKNTDRFWRIWVQKWWVVVWWGRVKKLCIFSLHLTSFAHHETTIFAAIASTFCWVGLNLLQFYKSLFIIASNFGILSQTESFKVFHNSKADKTLAKDDIWLLHCSTLLSEWGSVW